MVGKCIVALVIALPLALARPSAQQTHTFIDASLASESAPDGGIAVRIAVPVTSRHVNGAPVAIFVPGGGGADAYQIREYAAGVISITFAFPGGELDGRRSGGSADSRGPVALRALADVVQFALGRVRTTDGRLLRDVAPYPILENVGLVGWSRGGDAVINALARYAEQTRGVRWIVTHESPAFDSAMTGEIVVRPGSAAAPADYVPHTCALLACQVLYPNLRWEASSRPGGSLYLDRNGNGRPDLASEPALPGNLLPGTTRRVFTLAATQAALTGGVFGSRWPDTVATVTEASDYWSWRDTRFNLAALSAAHPGLAMIMHVTEQDHVQSSVDHPHIALVYNSLRLAGMPWVRMNPDSAYTRDIAAGLPDNAANAALPSDFSAWLVPETLASDVRIANAAVLELSDRVHLARWDLNLDAPLQASAYAHDLHAPDPSTLRSLAEQDRIWATYERLIAWSAANLAVVTSADVAAMALTDASTHRSRAAAGAR